MLKKEHYNLEGLRNEKAHHGGCTAPNFEFVHGDICNNELVNSLLPAFNFVITLATIVRAPACKLNASLTKFVNYDAHMNIARNVSAGQKVLFPTTNSCLWYWYKR